MGRARWAALLLSLGCDASSLPSGAIDGLPAESVLAQQGRCPREPSLDLELPVWDLYVSERAWEALHEDVTAEVQVDALLCIKGRQYAIGLELQGASTRTLKKKSFDLKFAKRDPLDEAPFGQPERLRRILLKAMSADQSLIREAIAFEALRDLGHITPRVNFTNLRINGAYWGLYNLLEPINYDFLARHDVPDHGHLYKAVRTKLGRADFKPGRDLRHAFEDKSDQETDSGWDDLAALAQRLQRTPPRHASFLSEIDRVFPLAPYIDRMIWIAVTQNGDAVAQNFYLYNAPIAGQDAWTLFPWDSNIAFGVDWTDQDGLVSAAEQPMVDGGSYFGGRLLEVPELRAQYIARFRALLEHELSADRLLAYEAELAHLVRHDLAEDQRRWRRKIDPQRAFEGIEHFLRERSAVLRAELDVLEAR